MKRSGVLRSAYLTAMLSTLEYQPCIPTRGIEVPASPLRVRCLGARWRRPAQDSIIDGQNKLGTAAGEAAGWDLRQAVRNGLGADLFRGQPASLDWKGWYRNAGIASIGPDGRRVGSR
jgi:hypothetical protein